MMIVTDITLIPQGKKIVRTNGCFDLLHPWHLETFKQAKAMWDILVVGVNADSSPYFMTKPWRPINNEQYRVAMLDSIRYIDYVCLFDTETPISLITTLQPAVIVKGWDYIPETVIGYEEAKMWWWEVKIIPLVGDYSTSNIVNKILEGCT